ncbi:hypothetical protein F444_07678 [Phytophthora nicotianae P1976]|nr:hypothetical protein F444_07678 [Phytophthora nicotianae P1976]
MGVSLIGCASHRLNLAVREYLAPLEDALAEVQALMRKLRTLKQAAKLRQKLLSSQSFAKTRDGRRRSRCSPVISALEPIQTLTLIPSRTTHRSLRKLFDELHDVESISKKLQSDGQTLLDARDLLDGLLEVHPAFGNYLAPNAPIVHSPKFEFAVVKMLGGKATRLTTAEKALLQPFRRVAAAAAPLDDEQSTSFAERILKRRNVDAAPITFFLLSAIPPTSNVVERLFSSARSVLRHERHRLSSQALEMILFLKANSSYWNVAIVDACLL